MFFFFLKTSCSRHVKHHQVMNDFGPEKKLTQFWKNSTLSMPVNTITLLLIS